MKRLVLVAALAAAVATAVPASAEPPVLCTPPNTITDCVKDLLESVVDTCIPNGDLESGC